MKTGYRGKDKTGMIYFLYVENILVYSIVYSIPLYIYDKNHVSLFKHKGITAVPYESPVLERKYTPHPVPTV